MSADRQPREGWQSVGRTALAADLEHARGDVYTAVQYVLSDLHDDDDPTAEDVERVRLELQELFYAVDELAAAVDGAEAYGELLPQDE